MSQRVPDFPPEYDFMVHCSAAINRQDYRGALESLKRGLRRSLGEPGRIDGAELAKHLQSLVGVLEANLRAAYGYDWEHNVEVPKIVRGQGSPRCSFCGKREGEVTKIISGGPVSICDECVGVCNKILADESAGSGGGIA